MANEDRIDSIVDRGAVQKELAETSAEVRQLIDLIKSVKNTSIQITGAKSVGEFNTLNKQLQDQIQLTNTATVAVKNHTKAVDENTKATIQESQTLKQNIELRRQLQNTVASYKKDQKEDLALLKTGAINRAEYNRRLTESQVKIDTYKVRIAELNRVIKEDIALEGKAVDAYKQLSAEYNRASLQAKNYQVVLGANNPKTIEAVTNAKRLSDQLKDVDNQVGQNTRNVGNYGGAIVSTFGKAFGFLRTISYILPGIGIAGILGLVSGAVVDLVSGLFKSEKAFNQNKVAAQAFKDALKEVNDEAIKTSTSDITKLELYRSILNDTTRTQKERNEALVAYNQLADDSNKIDASQLNNLNLINTKINEQIFLIEKRALSRAAESILGKKAEALLLAQESARLEAEKKQANEEAITSTQLEQAGVTKINGIRLDYINQQSTAQRKLEIQRKIDSDAEVKRTKTEFEASKQALYGLINVEGFKAEQVKAIKEKSKKEDKKDNTEEANAKARFEILKLELQIRADFANEIVKDEKKTYSERLLALNDYALAKQAIIDATARYELTNAKLTAEEVRLIEAKRIDAALRLAHELSEAIKQTVDDFHRAEPAMTKAVDGMTKSMAKAIEEIQKKNNELKDGLEKNALAIKNAVKSLLSEVQGLIFDLFTNDIDREKNAIQDRIDLLDKQKQKEIEVVNQSIASAQDKAAQIAVIEARAAAEKEQLERRQRELDQRKAKFERAEAVVNIIANTARGVTAALASVPPNPILAAIVGAIGAVQLARTLAQPIPKYGKGTDNHKGGLMEVGDAGKAEGILLPDGSLLKSPSRSTFMDAPAGTKVFPDYDQMMLNATMTKVPVFNVKTSSDTKDAINKIGKDIVRAIKNQPQTTFKGEPRWKVMTRTGSTFRTYLDNNL